MYPLEPQVTETMLFLWLNELVEAGKVAAYNTSNGQLGQVTNFTLHEKISHAYPSRLTKCVHTSKERFCLDSGALPEYNQNGARQEVGVDVGVDTEANASEASASPPEPVPEKPLLPESAGAFYGRCLKAVCWPSPLNGSTQRTRESRDISVLNRQLKTRRREEIVVAATELRRQADAGDLAGFISPREGFGLPALFADAKGGITTFERFLHAALKRGEQNAKRQVSSLTPLGASMPTWDMEHA